MELVEKRIYDGEFGFFRANKFINRRLARRVSQKMYDWFLISSKYFATDSLDFFLKFLEKGCIEAIIYTSLKLKFVVPSRFLAFQNLTSYYNVYYFKQQLQAIGSNTVQF